MRFFLFIIVAAYTCCINNVAAKEHPCANDALGQAKKLVRFHDEGSHQDNEIADGTRAIEVGPVRALKGDGVFDVVEVTSAIYKVTYRMRLIYMRTSGCPLVGQEILEVVGPTG